MKYKILIVEDDRFWEDMKRYKQVRFTLPEGEKRIEPIVVHGDVDVHKLIRKHKPDLVSFNGILPPDNLFETVKKLKKVIAKNIPIAAVSFLPPLNIPKNYDDWFKIGLKDFYYTLVPYDRTIDFYLHILTTKTKDYYPRFYGGQLYWGAKMEWLGLRKDK